MMIRYLLVMTSSIGLAALMVVQASAEQRRDGPSWKVEGETLRVKNGNELTWTINHQDVQNRGRPKTKGFWFRLDRWDDLGPCFVGKEMYAGTIWKAREDRADVSWRFSDESTLRAELIDETVCVVKRSATGLDFGTWSTRWKVTGVSGRYEGATGVAEGSGTFDQLWTNKDSQSSSYEGSYKIYFD
jgi:hypothetical protein